MKKFSKILSVALLVALVLSLGVANAFAEVINSEATIQIQNGEYDSNYFEKKADEIDYATHTYKAAQILKADEYDTESEEYAGLDWGAQVTDSGAAILAALKSDTTWTSKFTKYVTDPAEVTNENPLFTAAAFASEISGATADQAKALAKVLKGLYGGQGQEISGTDEVTLTAGIGYYLIDDVTAAADLADDAANPTILFAAPGSNKIRIKVDKPSQDKQVKENEAAKAGWNEVSDYNIGDAVPYKITSKVPNTENFEKYTMKFTDTMSEGLTLYDIWSADATNVAPTNTTTANVKVTIGETDVTDNVTIDKNARGFVLTLDIKTGGQQAAWAPVGKAITIEFFGVLNENAVIGLDGNSNKSKLEYSNNPDDDTSKTETPEDTVLTFTYELDVTKTDGKTSEKLPGAQFALKAVDGEHAGKYVVVNTAGKVVKWQDAAPEEDAEADADGNNALLTSDKDGKFNITGLDDGKYSLEEIKAPAGYNKIDPIAIEIIAGTVHTADGETPANALETLKIKVGEGEKAQEQNGDTSTGIVATGVENNSGATLPSTGGIGTTIFYVVGGVLVLAAIILLVTKKRMSE